MGLPSFRRTAPKTKICDSYMSFKETCLFTSFFFVFKLFLNVFLHFSRKFFFSSGTFFFPVHEVGSSWQDGSCATQLPPARRCASRIKRQKLWRYCAAKREALSSGGLGGAP